MTPEVAPETPRNTPIAAAPEVVGFVNTNPPIETQPTVGYAPASPVDKSRAAKHTLAFAAAILMPVVGLILGTIVNPSGSNPVLWMIFLLIYFIGGYGLIWESYLKNGLLQQNTDCYWIDGAMQMKEIELLNYL